MIGQDLYELQCDASIVEASLSLGVESISMFYMKSLHRLIYQYLSSQTACCF